MRRGSNRRGERGDKLLPMERLSPSRVADLGLTDDDITDLIADLSPGVVEAICDTLVRFEDALAELTTP